MPADPTRGDDAPKRRAISKRLRFEILRRDAHTCRYCGAQAPNVTLVVDHVQPVALGGQTVPENLVAACRDCNSGKTSTAPNSPIVDNVTDDALRWARATVRAAELLRMSREEELQAADSFRRLHWSRWKVGDDEIPLPVGWEQSILRFFNSGLSLDDLGRAVDIMAAKDRMRADDRFRYFCGICWRWVEEIQRTAAALFWEEGADGAA